MNSVEGACQSGDAVFDHRERRRRRGAARGEVRATAPTPRIAGVGPDLLRQYFLAHHPPIPDQVLTEIVDDVIMPLIRR